jgi:U4/U6 small nuclear ribonucleoprotein PRP4
MNLPTDDKLVMARLRELGEPIILFGEQAPERRDRLRDLLIRKGLDNAMPSTVIPGYEPAGAKPTKAEPDELFYTEGTPLLKAVRTAIAKFSIPRAQERLARAKLLRIRDENDGGATLAQEAA